MARLVWGFLCQHQSTDANGLNSYNSLFENMGVRLMIPKGAPKPIFPLSRPCMSSPFVLACKVRAEPGMHDATITVYDSDNQPILPPHTMQVRISDNGMGNLHVQFAQGIPLLRPGIYSFEWKIGDQVLQRVEMPVSISFQEV